MRWRPTGVRPPSTELLQLLYGVTSARRGECSQTRVIFHCELLGFHWKESSSCGAAAVWYSQLAAGQASGWKLSVCTCGCSQVGSQISKLEQWSSSLPSSSLHSPCWGMRLCPSKRAPSESVIEGGLKRWLNGDLEVSYRKICTRI